jgi:2,3-bisphosphoglycerate-independent phosphoglycerate mutase
MSNKKLCMLMILDGWGIGSADKANAVLAAKTPCLDRLWDKYPHTSLLCSGKPVGLPEGIMGNSEVGHMNIGAGRTVFQDLLRIDLSIRDKTFFENNTLNAVMSQVKEKNTALHLTGLLSDGGVHSQEAHLFALLDMAQNKGVKNVYVHAILDGRDTPPDSGEKYLTDLQEHIKTNNFGKIASVCGRFYAMDRDKRWDRVEHAYQLFAHGKGNYQSDPVQAVRAAYLKNETDEFVKPIVINPDGTVKNGDGIIFFNFRADRAREITRVFTDPEFNEFKRDPLPKLCGYVCMTTYDEKFKLPVAFPPVHLNEILGKVVSDNHLTQLRIAETEKYAHVTYFFNGGQEQPFPSEDRCLIPSPREIETYDLKPEMSAHEVMSKTLSKITSGKYDLIVLNFANMDMVGHTGVFDAAVRAVETVDYCADKIVNQVLDQKGTVLVTADHGNAEKMTDEQGNIHTAHTLNPVPFILVDDSRKNLNLKSGGCLGDIAPTIIEIVGLNKPEQMTGQSLI